MHNVQYKVKLAMSIFKTNLLVSALLIAMIPIHEAGHSLNCLVTAGMPFPGLASIGAYTSCVHIGKGDVGHRHDLYISGGMFAGIVALSLLAWPTLRKSAPFATAIILAAIVQFAIAAVESLAWDFYTSISGIVFANVIYYLPVAAMAQNFRKKARPILAIAILERGCVYFAFVKSPNTPM